MALSFDFFRPKKTEEFYMSSEGKPKNRFLLALSEAFETKGKKITKGEKLSKRIPFEKLELAYRLDALAFRCINFYAAQVAGPGFHLVSNDAKAKQVCQDFCDKVHITEKIEELVRDGGISGNGWWELIFNFDETKLIDIARIDYRFMDYKREPGGMVAEDESGNILGYKFKDWSGQELDLEPRKIVHFKLFGSGNELGLGFIEPLYRTIYDKLNAADGFSQEQWRRGHQLFIIYYGDKPDTKSGYTGHPPKQEVIDKISEEFEDVSVRNKFVLPYWVKVETISPAEGGDVELLNFFNSIECAGFGIPQSIALGGGGKGERATLEVSMVRDMDRRIKSYQNKISTLIENEIFTILQEQYKFKKIPKIKWNEITPPDLNRLAKRIIEYVAAGIMTTKEAKKIIRDIEGIPEEKIIRTKKGTEKLMELVDVEKIISLLKAIKISFPDDTINRLIDKILSEILSKSMRTEIKLADIEAKHISIEEAILFLKSLKDMFQGEDFVKFIDELINNIMLKSTTETVKYAD